MYYLEIRFNSKSYESVKPYILEIKKLEIVSSCHDYYYFCFILKYPLNQHVLVSLKNSGYFYFVIYYKQ